MKRAFSLVVPSSLKRALFQHLFPGDGDEHGAILSAGIVETERGLRLLARDLVCAVDGRDYVPGRRGYRMLTGAFVTTQIRRCRDERLSYLAIHNHGGTDRVSFSSDDMASHERGYPALLDIARGQPVGALVVAPRAAAGDLWLDRSSRLPLDEMTVVGSSIDRLYPAPPSPPTSPDETYDRQSRIFGEAGQSMLRKLKVGVIGAGGVGSLIVQYLARVGVGHLVVVDPERVEPSNLSRIVEATRWDARAALQHPTMPAWVRRLARQTARTKVDIMNRIARRASPRIRFEGIHGDVVDGRVATRFRDCDFLFLAADSFQARLVFNSLVCQYLIPGVQVGSKVPVDAATGNVGEVYTVARPVTPDSGCLWCNGLIPPARLQEESATTAERQAQRYVDDATVIAPSVITLNAAAVGFAVNDFLFSMTGLRRSSAAVEDYMRILPRVRSVHWDEPRREPACVECGSSPASRFARGDSRALPTR